MHTYLFFFPLFFNRTSTSVPKAIILSNSIATTGITAAYITPSHDSDKGAAVFVCVWFIVVSMTQSIVVDGIEVVWRGKVVDVAVIA